MTVAAARAEHDDTPARGRAASRVRARLILAPPASPVSTTRPKGTLMDTSSYGEKKLTRAQRWALILPAMRRPYPLEALADLCRVSVRQINRDIRELRDMGHRIEVRERRAFFAEGAAPADYMLAKLFSTELRFLIDLAEAYGLPHTGESIERLFQAAPEIASAPSLPLVTSHTPLALDDEMRARLKTLQSAIDNRHVITFNYTDKAQRETFRSARPVLFVIHQGTPYLIAFDTRRNNWRTFNTNNMSTITLTPSTFAGYDRGEVLRALEHSPSRLFTGIPERLQIRFTGEAAAQARRSHVVTASPNRVDREGELIVDLLAADRHECFLWLLGFGEHAEVLGPPDARLDFSELAGRIAERHRLPSTGSLMEATS